MKILMLHPHDVRYQPWTIRMVKLAEELALRGHSIRVGFIEDKHALEPDYPRIREIPEGPVEYAPLRSRDKQTHKNIFQVVGMAKDMDLIHFQKCFPSTAIPALWASWKWKIPLHYDWDDNESLILREITGLPPGFKTQARFFEKRLPKYVDTISVASDGLWEVCKAMGFPEERMRKVPVGADLAEFDPNARGNGFRTEQPFQIGDRPLVAYIGQLEGAAYATLFLQACDLLRDRFPDSVWMVVGGGKMLDRLEERACAMNLSHRVVFTDYLPGKRIPEALAAADIAVACFSDEQFVRCKSPLKIAEYLAAGKAIVASDVGEVRWMTGGAAELVRPGDAEAMAQAIGRLLGNPERRRELGRLARKRAEEEVNWKRSADRLEEAYILSLKGA
jgi:glycosyltransferase involved in cell wall biosynthesis